MPEFKKNPTPFMMKNSALHASAKHGSPMQANYSSPIKQDKSGITEGEMDTLKKTGEFTREEATEIATKSTVLPEVTVTGKKRTKFTEKDLEGKTREQKGYIYGHARKHGYELGGKTVKLTGN